MIISWLSKGVQEDLESDLHQAQLRQVNQLDEVHGSAAVPIITTMTKTNMKAKEAHQRESRTSVNTIPRLKLSDGSISSGQHDVAEVNASTPPAMIDDGSKLEAARQMDPAKLKGTLAAAQISKPVRLGIVCCAMEQQAKKFE
ncbi:hypothetical protein ON010_g9943 [Phytophthora cinnamomi]|nr:hypothetical protein ON010_g9943 [Phytophthora cinnamomi]